METAPPSSFTTTAASAPTSVLVVAGLALGPAIALGFARFSYALLLPAMRADLHWSYASAGFSNTANALGYLLGALITAPVAARVGDKRAFAIGLAITVAALLGSGLTSDFLLLAGLRAIAGIGGALPFITGAALASAAGEGGGAARPARFLGVYFGGAGFGMLVAALLIPEITQSYGWRDGWLAMGALGLLGFGISLLALRYAPSQLRTLNARAGRPSFGSAVKEHGPGTPPSSPRML